MKRLAMLLSAALVAIGYVAIDAGPARAAGPIYNLFHFNVAGHAREGGNDQFGSGQESEPVHAIYNSLTENENERAASLNELCRNQFDKLMSKLGSNWQGRFVATAWKNQTEANNAGTGTPEEPYKNNTENLCKQEATDGQEHNYGNAILVRKAPIVAGSEVRKWLGSPDGNNEHRAMICITAKPNVTGAVETRFCSTHIDSDFPFTQIGEVANKVNSFNKPVILMGDFNQVPTHDALDKIYHSANGGGGEGKFGEVDQGSTPCRCGEATAGSRKIDYIFFIRADFDRKSGNVTNAITESDHHILRGQVEAT